MEQPGKNTPRQVPTGATITAPGASSREYRAFPVASQIPHDDYLLSPNELAHLVGLNIKAVREAMKDGLKCVQIGTGRRPFLRTTLRAWREYLEAKEHTKAVRLKAAGLLNHPRTASVQNPSSKVKS